MITHSEFDGLLLFAIDRDFDWPVATIPSGVINQIAHEPPQEARVPQNGCALTFNCRTGLGRLFCRNGKQIDLAHIVQPIERIEAACREDFTDKVVEFRDVAFE